MTSDVHQLASGLGFSLNDLVLNRLGKLSSGQTWTSVKSALIAVGLLTVSVVGVPGALLLRPQKLVKVILIVMGVAGAVIFGFLSRMALQDLFTRKPNVAEGRVELVGGTRGTHVRIGSFDGMLPIGALDYLDPKIRYRVYYLPGTKRFLSIEPIEPPPSEPRSDGPK